MAKQTGIPKLTGSIGNITFYKTRHGYLAKQKNCVSRERIPERTPLRLRAFVKFLWNTKRTINTKVP
jgi:hypothetical protein